MERRIVIPEGMLKAAWSVVGSNDDEALCSLILEAALRWLSENPQFPTPEQACSIARYGLEFSRAQRFEDNSAASVQAMLLEWQRCMFLAPAPEIPEEVKDLWEQAPMGGSAQDAILEAFRRGTMRGVDPSMLKPGCLLPGQYAIGNIKAPK